MEELATPVVLTGDLPEIDPFTEATFCLNCGALLESAYCSACGQKRPRRLDFLNVVTDAAQNFVSLDSRFLRTVVGLTWRPGHVAREYIVGRRNTYTSPLKFMFFCTTLYVVLYAVFDIEFYQPDRWETVEGQASFDFVMNLLPYLIFVELLPVAGLQRLLFRKASYNVAESYVTQLYAYGQAILYAAPFGLLGLGGTALGLLGLRLISLPVITWTLVQFYQQGVGSTLIKAVLLYVVYLILSVLAGIAAAQFFFMFLS